MTDLSRLKVPYRFALLTFHLFQNMPTTVPTMYGKKTLPLSFSMVFSMIMGMGSPGHGWPLALHQTELFALGGCFYAVYSLIIAGFLQFRTRQQALGEVLQGMAGYLRRQADFYDPQIPMDDCYKGVIEQKALVADRLQVARDLIFRTLRTPRDGMLAATLSEMLELFERLLSSQTDYSVLREHFSDAGILVFYRDIALKAGQDLENIGMRLMRGRIPRGGVFPHPSSICGGNPRPGTGSPCGHGQPGQA